MNLKKIGMAALGALSLTTIATAPVIANNLKTQKEETSSFRVVSNNITAKYVILKM